MKDKLIPLKIAGVGYSLPETVITNDDLTKLYETSDEWIYTRTGIKERRVVSGNESAIDLGERAAKNAIEKSGLKADDIDMVILPGGMPGTLNLEANKCVQNTIDYCTERDIPIAAICAAPSILGHKGLLDGKNAVCYPGFESELKGANILNTTCVVDGNIITAAGMGAALEFSYAIIEKLISKERAELLKAAIIDR